MGLHYQLPPAAEVKVVRAIKGALWDGIVDLRAGSTTYPLPKVFRRGLRHPCGPIPQRPDESQFDLIRESHIELWLFGTRSRRSTTRCQRSMAQPAFAERHPFQATPVNCHYAR